jgi:hypothetical protein
MNNIIGFDFVNKIPMEYKVFGENERKNRTSINREAVRRIFEEIEESLICASVLVSHSIDKLDL